MSDAPKSPIRNVFKKKRKENDEGGEYQELEEVLSSDLDCNHDPGQSYLPSSLRFDNTIQNFSPTRSLDGIKQFDEYTIDDSDDDNDDLQLRGKQLFGAGNDTETEPTTEDIFIEDYSYESDNDTDAGATATAIATATATATTTAATAATTGVSLETDTDSNTKMDDEDDTLALDLIPVPVRLVDPTNTEEQSREPPMTDENNGNNNGISFTMTGSNGSPTSTSLMSGMHSEVNDDIASTGTGSGAGNDHQQQQQHQHPQDSEGASASVKDDSVETADPQSRPEANPSSVESSTAIATSSSVSVSVSTSTSNSNSTANPNTIKRPRESILRSSSVEGRPWASQSSALRERKLKFASNGDEPSDTGTGTNAIANTNANANDNEKINTSKKAVSFADENGGIISEQQTIDVSPSKLSRKIRRGRNSSPYPYGDEDDDDGEKVQKGVMGRILVLLMDPPSKQYELTSLPYPLVSNENGIVGPTQLKDLLGLVANSASFEPLRQKTYKAFMRPEEAVAMDNEKTILDYKIVKDEVLVSIPEGYNAEECARFSKPILQDKRLVRLLKKLKKHERKAVKKRRLKSNGMKPSRYGSEASREIDLDPYSRSGLEDVTKKLIDDADAVEGVKRNWFEIVAKVILTVLIALIVVGAVQYLLQRNADGKLLHSMKTKVQDKEQLCGRGAFCRPFGVKQDLHQQENAFMARLRDGIKKWKLENDDLLL